MTRFSNMGPRDLAKDQAERLKGDGRVDEKRWSRRSEPTLRQLTCRNLRPEASLTSGSREPFHCKLKTLAQANFRSIAERFSGLRDVSHALPNLPRHTLFEGWRKILLRKFGRQGSQLLDRGALSGAYVDRLAECLVFGYA